MNNKHSARIFCLVATKHDCINNWVKNYIIQMRVQMQKKHWSSGVRFGLKGMALTKMLHAPLDCPFLTYAFQSL